MAEKVKVILADDHPLFRAGVRQSLEQSDTIDIAGEAASGEEALKLILDLKPHVAILDIQMPNITGLEVAKRIEHMNLDAKVVLLTMLDDKRIFFDAMECGVLGYVLKDSAVSEIRHAVESVCEGKYYISPSLSGLLVERRKGRRFPPELKDLTPTELRVIKLISDLKSNKEIADELLISKRTVENHRVNIVKKLHLEGSNALLKLALKHKSEL